MKIYSNKHIIFGRTHIRIIGFVQEENLGPFFYIMSCLGWQMAPNKKKNTSFYSNVYFNPELEVENIPTRIILKNLLGLHPKSARHKSFSSKEIHCKIFSIQHAFCTELERWFRNTTELLLKEKRDSGRYFWLSQETCAYSCIDTSWFWVTFWMWKGCAIRLGMKTVLYQPQLLSVCKHYHMLQRSARGFSTTLSMELHRSTRAVQNIKLVSFPFWGWRYSTWVWR